jgi:hypothetical protein
VTVLAAAVFSVTAKVCVPEARFAFAGNVGCALDEVIAIASVGAPATTCQRSESRGCLSCRSRCPHWPPRPERGSAASRTPPR